MKKYYIFAMLIFMGLANGASSDLGFVDKLSKAKNPVSTSIPYENPCITKAKVDGIAFYKVSVTDLEQTDFAALRRSLIRPSLGGNRHLVQVVGDASPLLTPAGGDFLTQYFKTVVRDDGYLITGITGDQADAFSPGVNAVLNRLAQRDSSVAEHCVGILTSAILAQMRGDSKIGQFVWIQGKEGEATTFEDGKRISDHLLQPGTGDRLLIVGGRVHAMIQALNCLERDIPIEVVIGTRDNEGSISVADLLAKAKDMYQTLIDTQNAEIPNLMGKMFNEETWMCRTLFDKSSRENQQILDQYRTKFLSLVHKIPELVSVVSMTP